MDETDTRYGTVEPEDGGARLEFRRTWPDDGDDVWAALTDPARTQRWIGRYEGKRAPGATGTFEMTFEGEGPPSPMTVVECVEPHRLVLDLPATNWRLELDLVTQRGGTTLIFVQRFADAAAVPDVATGWHWYLDRLDAELRGTEPPGDWDAFVAEVGPRYGWSPA
jgi:uncharacterized protein YndB with AHSA1/START domain